LVVMVGPVTVVMPSAAGGEVAPPLSLTVTLNEELPAVVGVPPITPVEAFRDKPAGSEPLATVQLPYGGVPPAAASVCEYATPTSPLGSEAVVISGPATIVIGKVFGAEVRPPLSVTVKVGE